MVQGQGSPGGRPRAQPAGATRLSCGPGSRTAGFGRGSPQIARQSLRRRRFPRGTGHREHRRPPAGGGHVGAYHIDGILGEGGFSIVYAASQTVPIRRDVALKVIKPGMDSAQVLGRFESERQTLARMQHPGIATVLDGGTTPTGHPFFVMERVQGTPITSFAREHGLDLDGRLDLFLQVCQAVQHAHQKGVVHRDIKPSNVLVSQGDEGPRAQVIDFGIAKTLVGDGLETALQTQQGMLLGTPEYMSPEQASGDVLDVDTRADVYSLGVLLYELLTGQRPFAKDTAASLDDLRRQIREVEPLRPSTRLERAGVEPATRISTRALRGDLDWIVMRALEKDRERRYPSAMALAEDIERYLDHEPVLAGPPSRIYRMSKFARRNRGAITAMAGILMALSGGLGLAVAGMNKAQEQSREAERARGEEKIARDDAETALAVAREQRAQAQSARQEAESARDLAKAEEKRAKEAADAEREARKQAEVSLSAAESSEGFLSRVLQAASPDDQEGELTMRTVLDQASADLETEDAFDAFPEVKSRMHRVIATCYRNLGAFEPSEAHFNQAMAILEPLMDRDAPALIRLEIDLYRLRYDQSRQAETLEPLTALVDRTRAALGESHELTMEAESTLAGVLFDEGRIEESKAILETLIPRQEASEDPDDFEIIGNLGNLAVMYGFLGQPDEALKTAQAARDRAVEVAGEDHPRTLNSTHALATTYAQRGEWQPCADLLEDLVSRRKRFEGEEHMGTIGSINLLALAYHKSGRFELAERTYRECLELHKKVLGEDHRQTMMCMHNLGMLLYDTEQFEEAERVLRESVQLLERSRGDLHQETLAARYHLWSMIAEQDRFDEAAQPYQEVVQQLFDNLGADHPLTGEAADYYARFLRKHAKALEAGGDWKGAEAKLLEVIALWQQLGNQAFPVALCTALAGLYERHDQDQAATLWRDRAEAAK
ncbi:MAG: tetratricopeptide repeat protein [Planctomycetota bacterium]